MSNQVQHPLRLVSKKILENWGMMLADEISYAEAEFSQSEPLYMSWVDVKGVIDGALSIVAPRSFVSTLARNVIGMDEDEEVSDQDLEDAFCEMGNIMAGNFFTEAFGDQVVFEIIKPKVSIVAHEELDKIKSRKVKYFFIADDHPLAVTFSVKG